MSSDPQAGAPNGRWTDHQVEQLIGRLLQIGVMVSAAVVVIGAAMFLVQHGRDPIAFQTFGTTAPTLATLGGIIRGALAFDSASIVQFGLVLLIATPVLRVALTLVAFVLQRDRLYVAITAVVLALLVYGLVWGRA